MDDINYREIVLQGLSLVVGIVIYALCFNMILNPFGIVVSGFTGVSTVLQELFGISPTIFLCITNFVLLIVSIVFLGREITRKNIIGSILYPLMISITSPIAVVLSDILITDDFYLALLMAVIMYGVGSGLIYRSGFTTGGSDIIMQIINKYLHISESRAMVFANVFVILLGTVTFGVKCGIYGLIILLTSTYFVDKIMFGTSNSKMLYIYTKKCRKVKKLILNEFNTGLTMIPVKGGYTSKRSHMIMCVVANNDYYLFKQKILEVDPQAFIISHKCYEVSGGVKGNNLLFRRDKII